MKTLSTVEFRANKTIHRRRRRSTINNDKITSRMAWANSNSLVILLNINIFKSISARATFLERRPLAYKFTRDQPNTKIDRDINLHKRTLFSFCHCFRCSDATYRQSNCSKICRFY